MGQMTTSPKTPLEQMLTQELDAIRPQLFELRRRVVELEVENRELKGRLVSPPPPRPNPPESGFAFGISDASGVRELVVPGAFVKIGTDASCRLKIEGARLMHAAIERDGEAVTVIDFGTQEGTLVNGERIERKTPLRSGDILGINGAQIVVVFA